MSAGHVRETQYEDAITSKSGISRTRTGPRDVIQNLPTKKRSKITQVVPTKLQQDDHISSPMKHHQKFHDNTSYDLEALGSAAKTHDGFGDETSTYYRDTYGDGELIIANQVAVAVDIRAYSILDIVELSVCLQRAQELERFLLRDIAQHSTNGEQEKKDIIGNFTMLIEKLEGLQASDDGLIERMRDLDKFVENVGVRSSRRALLLWEVLTGTQHTSQQR